MMRNLFVLSKVLLLVGLSFYISSCCKSDLQGDYLLDDFADQYLLDTSIKQFYMIDSHGFKESFIRMDNNAYFMYEGGDIDRCGVEFRIQYFHETFMSTVNRYLFEYTLWSSTSQEEGPRLWIIWNNDLHLDYDLREKSLLGEDIQVSFEHMDSLMVQGKKYTDVIKVSFYEDGWTLYIAPPYGLIKIIRPDGIYSERIP